jgi:hypothetical protein
MARQIDKNISPVRRALVAAMVANAVLPTAAFAQKNKTASQASTDMKIKLTFNNQSMIASLYDNPTARDFYSMLPLDLSIESYGNNEKITYLPRKLTDEGSGPFGNEAPGDIGYFAPWGNLALYHDKYRWSEGVIRLGRFEGSIDPLRTPGKFPLKIERAP